MQEQLNIKTDLIMMCFGSGVAIGPMRGILFLLASTMRLTILDVLKKSSIKQFLIKIANTKEWKDCLLMTQSKKISAIETLASTSAGFIISLMLAYYILPIWGFEPAVKEALEITIVFTLASLIRGYVVRRIFNN